MGSMSNSITAVTQPLFLLVDGHSLAFRSYYAYAKSRQGGLKTSTGIPTSVCFGFLKALLEAIASQKPQSIAIAFDLEAPTFRHETDANYKAGRDETPADFIPDIKNLYQLLAALNLQMVTSAGYEADDAIATLAQKGCESGYRVKVLTGDRDLFQLVDSEKNISVLYLSNERGKRDSGPIEFSPERVKEKLGVQPSQVVDYKALCGDSSDNIPGVRGIGEKTAVKLLGEYETLDDIYEAIRLAPRYANDKIKGATKKKLEDGKDAAYHSQYLAQLRFDVPIEITPEDCQLKGFDASRVEPLFLKLEFKAFLGRLKQLQAAFGGQVNETVEEVQAEEDDTWFWSSTETATVMQQKKLPFEPRIINTQAKLTELVHQLLSCTDKNNPVAWDTETTSLKPRDARLVGIGCCWGMGENDVAYIPIGHVKGENLDRDNVLEIVCPILESEDYPKVLQNAKFDRLVLRCQGIELKGVVGDTMLASYLLNPEQSHSLSELSRKYLELHPKSYDQLVPKGKTIAEVDIYDVADYCGMDVYGTFHVYHKLRRELETVPNFQKLLLEVELPLERILAEMEYTGIRVNVDYLREMSKQLEKKLKYIEEQAYIAAGEEFNMSSPKQVSELLFDKLGLDTSKSRKIKTGYSTDAATLEKLQGEHSVVDAILNYRTLDKLKSTYVDALPQLVRADTQRVHTDFNQAATGTGRLSSSHPNLQNIPIRTEFSRQIRKAFLPEKGWLLVSADYSQIELRILAHLSQEPVLVEAYKRREDIHTVTARNLFEKDVVTSEERRLGKVINFGVIYGMGPQRFAREAGVTNAEGTYFIQRFYKRYPQVFAYLDKVKREAIAHGYVETIFGRRRYFKFESGNLQKLKGSNPEDINLNTLKPGRNDAGILRAAANAPIQGSSADIIKIAMVKLHQILQDYQARLLLQVHDELVFEIAPDIWETLRDRIKNAMESAVELTVPLVVDIHTGENWMDAK